MRTQINIPPQSMWRFPQEGIKKTFQENNPKILDRVRNDLRIKHYGLE
ncbi:MAG: hypothetical protein ACYCVH_10335 [Ignavibacteriaceae bacterium]